MLIIIFELLEKTGCKQLLYAGGSMKYENLMLQY